ncbi:hypothetical protein SLEP1_g26554 [Rubroshorea leprosula]|uniref:non-specific serine/threonine protein kinase n=1 Tax=Rubroshorea leprosula TaxID=152421 RepID=A0AAV5JZW5_9ROSI|nr:hypothetical protein SLEP1_g26554 [Rubroshorea leprosula]
MAEALNWVSSVQAVPGTAIWEFVEKTGELQILSQNMTVVWSANLTRKAQNPILQLLDSGNIVLIDKSGGNSPTYLRQSFDYPSDTLLPGMKMGWDLRTGLERRITAWKNSNDPSPGDFSWGIEPHGNPESVMRKGSQEYYRGGPFKGEWFSGTAITRPIPVTDSQFVANEEELYVIYFLKNKSLITRLIMNQTVSASQQYIRSEDTQAWTLYSYMPRDFCYTYGRCGSYSYCDITQTPSCNCLNGFSPISLSRWNSMDWSDGCVRNKPLNCQQGGIYQIKKVKVARCCTFLGGVSGCAIWFGDLTDIRQFPVGGQDLYIRMSASESERWEEKKENYKNEVQKEDMEHPVCELATIFHATNSFSLTNKLGQGGFGLVYKGELMDGQEIAVKRLSRSSGQALNEFKNEVKLIAKLQHRNLARLLGCCIEGEEKLTSLTYTNIVTLSLFDKLWMKEDTKLPRTQCFPDQTRRKELNWSKRFQIICGIARGLLYLHQDSRLQIVHRDLKASNVLLDSEMNPKISDFGMAKTFGGDQIEGNTNRVAGTYGYMVPEYDIDGLFSVKSDIFSFGVLLMEIVTGMKSRGLFHSDNSLNLIGHAWTLWKEGNPLELVDEFLGGYYPLSEVFRCIHISLLCVQQNPEDRPTVSSVVLMFASEIELPQPKEPGFLLRRAALETDSSSSKHNSMSINNVTITDLQAR